MGTEPTAAGLRPQAPGMHCTLWNTEQAPVCKVPGVTDTRAHQIKDKAPELADNAVGDQPQRGPEKPSCGNRQRTHGHCFRVRAARNSSRPLLSGTRASQGHVWFISSFFQRLAVHQPFPPNADISQIWQKLIQQLPLKIKTCNPDRKRLLRGQPLSRMRWCPWGRGDGTDARMRATPCPAG